MPSLQSTESSGLTRCTISCAQRVAAFLSKHGRTFAILFAIIILAESARVGWRGKHGDFGPVISVVNHIGAGNPLYTGNLNGPAYVYSPTFALLLAPLDVLPDPLIRSLWYLCSWAALIGSWMLSRRILFGAPGNTSLPQGYWVLAIAPMWHFAYYNALNGQTTPLMMFLVLLSYYLDQRDKSLLAGLSLAGSLLIKPFPIIFLGFYLLRRRLRTCLSTIAWLSLLLLLPILYFRNAYDTVLKDWIAVNRQQQTIYDISDWGHQSLSALWYRIFDWQRPPPFLSDPSDPVFWAIWASIALVALSTILFTLRSNRHCDPAADHATFALYMLCWAMLPPTSWKHYYVVLIFPLAVLAKYALLPNTTPRLARISLKLLVFSFFGITLLHIAPDDYKRQVFEYSPYLFMALSVFATLCTAHWLQARSPSTTPQHDPA